MRRSKSLNSDELQMDCSPVFFDESRIEEQAFSMLGELGLKRNPNLLSLSEEGAKRLGLNIENSQERLTEDTLIGHIISAEFTS